MKKAVAVFALIAVAVIGVTIEKQRDEANIESMEPYKVLVEDSFDGTNFTMPHKVLDEGFTYEVSADKNKLTYYYKGTAGKARNYTSIDFYATKTPNGFEWRCERGIIFKTEC